MIRYIQQEYLCPYCGTDEIFVVFIDHFQATKVIRCPKCEQWGVAHCPAPPFLLKPDAPTTGDSGLSFLKEK